MIASFGDKRTEDLYHGRLMGRSRRIPADVVTAALRKLDMIQAAIRLEELRVPPNNWLEALRGDLKSLHSIRINDQWRLVFRWEDGEAHEVVIADYH